MLVVFHYMHWRLTQTEERAKVSITLVEKVQAVCSVAHSSCVESAIISNMQADDTEDSRTRRAILRFRRCSEELNGIESVMVKV